MNPLRHHFPCFAAQPDWVYLDSAATAQKPACVIDTLSAHYRHGVANVHRAAHRQAAQITAQFERARASVAAFLGAHSAENIVWTRGSTEGINLVAQTWLAPRLRAGDVILVSALEHHANLVPWQQVAARVGATLRVIPLREDGALDGEAFLRLLDARVTFLALTAQSNVLGSLTDCEFFIRHAHAAGVPVLLDAAQAVVHTALNVSALDCDFLVCSGHKLYGPGGIGVLYGKTERLQAMSPWQYGGEMVAQVGWNESFFQAPPLRFEAGTPAVADALGLAAALQFLQAQDRAAIHEQERQLLTELEQGLESMPGVMRLSRAPQRAAIAAFTVNGLHAADIAAALDAENIAVRAGQLCASPLVQQIAAQGVVRASLAMYSNRADVQRLLAVLAQVVSPTRVAVPEPQASSAHSLESLLVQLCSARDWPAQQRLLMKLADAMPRMSEAERALAQRVEGCESKTWLLGELREGKPFFRFDSEARIVRGLATVLAAVANGQGVAHLTDGIAAYALDRHLSASRVNGMQAMVRALREWRCDGQD